RTYLCSYLERGAHRERLIVAVWNPIEAFDGKILDNRKRIGEHFYEAWRAVSPDDHVEIPTQIRIAGLAAGSVKEMALYDLLAESTEAAPGEPLEFDAAPDALLSPEIRVGPMPTILVIDIR
ncbi:MAG: hypothetical protein JXR94_14370, partial [Candidatus Hydrogenedentes bacterium]|nr:hypothetical protein [Candidatus Hydrogenedentota bacterium]